MQRDGRSRRSDRKSTRLNSSHITISYAVFCLKKKNEGNDMQNPFLEDVWQGIADQGFVCVRFNFPYKEKRGRAPDPTRVLDTCFFFFNEAATTEIYTLSLHDALPILNLFGSSKTSGVCSLLRTASDCRASKQ